jgi:uncharacterized protein with PIN domain
MKFVTLELAALSIPANKQVEIMQPYCNPAGLAAICVFAAQVRCPHCGDWMVAPVSSEFVEGVEIRHLWECDSCGEAFSISIPLTRD